MQGFQLESSHQLGIYKFYGEKNNNWSPFTNLASLFRCWQLYSSALDECLFRMSIVKMCNSVHMKRELSCKSQSR